jgi:hypothetical protein
MLQSCSINSEAVYHADSAATTVVDIDMKDAMSMVKSMMSSSSSEGKKGLDQLDKLPKTWTSLYELGKKEGKSEPKNPDSIRIMKKIFMKSNVENNEISGISLKMDHFTKVDNEMVKNFSKKEQFTIDNMAMNQWDGKTLTIDTEKLDLSSIKDIIANKIPSDEMAEMSPETLKMMFKNVGATLKFEKKIKSINGKHDWITKADDYSVRINYDLDYLFSKDKRPFQNADKKIIIVTE